MANQGKRMVSENLIAILKEMDNKGISIGDLAEMLEAFSEGDIQEKLTAGDNIQISEENVISATDTKYTAGTGIEISEANVISSQSAIYMNEITIQFNNNRGTYRTFIETKEQLTDSNVAQTLNETMKHSEVPLYIFNVNQIPTDYILTAVRYRSSLWTMTGFKFDSDNNKIIPIQESHGGNQPTYTLNSSVLLD